MNNKGEKNIVNNNTHKNKFPELQKDKIPIKIQHNRAVVILKINLPENNLYNNGISNIDQNITGKYQVPGPQKGKIPMKR